MNTDETQTLENVPETLIDAATAALPKNSHVFPKSGAMYITLHSVVLAVGKYDLPTLKKLASRAGAVNCHEVNGMFSAVFPSRESAWVFGNGLQ